MDYQEILIPINNNYKKLWKRFLKWTRFWMTTNFQNKRFTNNTKQKNKLIQIKYFIFTNNLKCLEINFNLDCLSYLKKDN